MSEKKIIKFNDEKLNLICWLIDRYDTLRSLTANRASLIISADAILLATSSLTLENIISTDVQYNTLMQILLSIGIGSNVLMLVISIFYAINSLAYVWKTNRQKLKTLDLPQCFFFHPRETVETLKTFKDFKEKFIKSSKKEMVNYALGKLQLVIHGHHIRYQLFRKSIRFLIVSMIPFIFYFVILFSRLFS